MQTSQRKTFLIYLLVNLLVFAISISFYFLFINAFELDFANKHITNSQAVLTESIDNEINEALVLFDEFTNTYTLTELNDLILTNNDLKSKGFIGFYNITNNMFTYESEDVLITASYLRDYRFGFFKQKFYLFNNDIAGVINFDVFLTKVSHLSLGNDLLIMSNQGEIYFNTNKGLYKDVLHQYLKEETGSYFENYLSLNKPLFINSKINNEDSYINFIPLESYNNLYVIEQYYSKDIQSRFGSLSFFLISLFFIMALLNFGVLLLVFYLTDKRAADIEDKKYKYFYNKPAIIKINKKGKIKRINVRTEEELKHFNENIDNVNELFTDDDALDKIQRGKMVTLKVDKKSISFLPLSFRRGYYLVGEYLSLSIASDEEVYRLAYCNRITNLPNMHLFFQDAENEILKLSPFDEEELYFIGFAIRGIEDVFGQISQVVKELVLNEVSKNLLNFAKEKEAKVYHTKDIEFILMLKGKNFKEIEKFVLKIIDHFEKPISFAENRIAVDLSSAILSKNGNDVSDITSEQLYSNIHETLKRALESPHQKYVVFDEKVTHYLSEKELLEKELRQAIKNKDFVPYFQAQYDYKKDRIIGFEALVRWDNPNYINKSPDLFISMAEETGLINDIGKIMTEKTFELAKELEKYDVHISLNVSAIELLRKGFVEELLAVHKKYELGPETITLEITETTFLQSFLLINEKIKALKRSGIHIHLDDFGTGYSSLPYIKELDFDTIKIDRTFVSFVETDKHRQAIVQMIITLAKRLGTDVIAEGVETKKQMDYLVRTGCNIFQGYYISRPIPFKDAKQLLIDHNVNKTISFKTKGRKK